MKLFFALGLAVFVFPAYAQDSQLLIEATQKSIADSFKDPDSAKFRNVTVLDAGKTKAICGEVNAKNSYGGYVGFRSFYKYEDSPNVVIKRGDPIMDKLVDLVCKPQ